MDETPYQRRIRQWRQRAEECRTLGDQMCDPGARSTFYRMAASYDRLAEGWERRAKREPGPETPKTG